MKGLSILIPEYNTDCHQLVSDLCRQQGLGRVDGWEVIVIDDGSPCTQATAPNKIISQWPHCQYIELEANIGRAAIRNLLASKARYDRLIFIDADMAIIDPRFIDRYLDCCAPVVYGGYKVMGHHPDNLRYLYERQAEPGHCAARRREHPDKDFHTSNYCIERQIAIDHPLDTSYREYGYEDVAYGQHLCQVGIGIEHIDNEVGFYDFEPNDHFINKTEEGLRTLYCHRHQLAGYSRIARWAEVLQQAHVVRPIAWLSGRLSPYLRRRLGAHPSLWLFSLYKLGYYLRLTAAQQQP